MKSLQSFPSFSDFKKKALKDPEIKVAYDKWDPYYTLLEKMIEKRHKEGLTQAQLAKKMGTKQSAISRFEAGNALPNLEFLYKLADGIGAKLKITVL